MDLVHLLIWLIVFCLIAGLVFYIVQMMPIPAPFKNIVIIAVCLILLLILLNVLGVLGQPMRLGMAAALPLRVAA